ncbi:MAG: cobalamin-binding protein [Chloroflexota bacterium]
MRIVSLLPSATEMIYALGLGDHVVGVTHECDYPIDAQTKPAVTYSTIDHSNMHSEEIDHAVRSTVQAGLSLYALDEALIADLKPDLIVTQALCDVCAVSYSLVEQTVAHLMPTLRDNAPHVLSFEPNSLDDILDTIMMVGAATEQDNEATTLVNQLRERIEQVRAQATHLTSIPRVACFEWVDPLYGPGHWLPELVRIAGGISGLGNEHQNSRRVAWSDVIAFAPEVIVVTPCGMSLEQTLEEASRVLPYRAGWHALPAVRSGHVYVVDGNSYFSRPGPRIVDSLELLAELIHPTLFAGWGPQGAWLPFHASATQSTSAPMS